MVHFTQHGWRTTAQTGLAADVRKFALIEHTHTYFYGCLWLLSHHKAVLGSWNRDHMVCRARITDHLALYRSLLTPKPD